jgi:hypothetical protein
VVAWSRIIPVVAALVGIAFVGAVVFFILSAVGFILDVDLTGEGTACYPCGPDVAISTFAYATAVAMLFAGAFVISRAMPTGIRRCLMWVGFAVLSLVVGHLLVQYTYSAIGRDATYWHQFNPRFLLLGYSFAAVAGIISATTVVVASLRFRADLPDDAQPARATAGSVALTAAGVIAGGIVVIGGIAAFFHTVAPGVVMALIFWSATALGLVAADYFLLRPIGAQ